MLQKYRDISRLDERNTETSAMGSSSEVDEFAPTIARNRDGSSDLRCFDDYLLEKPYILPKLRPRTRPSQLLMMRQPELPAATNALPSSSILEARCVNLLRETCGTGVERPRLTNIIPNGDQIDRVGQCKPYIATLTGTGALGSKVSNLKHD